MSIEVMTCSTNHSSRIFSLTIKQQIHHRTLAGAYALHEQRHTIIALSPQSQNFVLDIYGLLFNYVDI
jgi:hypothetical protein